MLYNYYKKIMAGNLMDKNTMNLFYKIFQNHCLPRKFGFDKRKHLSSLISSGQITREKAIEEIKKPLYDPKELIADTEFLLKNLILAKMNLKI